MAKSKARRGAIELQPVRGKGGVQYVLRAADVNPQLFDDEGLTGDAVIDGALAGVLEELGERDDQAKVSVYKYVLEGGVRKEAFAFECAPAEFSLQDLQETYGPGDYRIKIFGLQEGTNYRVNHFNKRLTIGPTRQAAKAAASSSPPMASGGVTVNGGGADIAKAIADSMAPIVAGMMRVMEKFAGGDRKAVIEEMRSMREIFLPAGGAAQDPLAQMKSLVEFAKLIQGDPGLAGGDAAPYAVIGKALDHFGPLLTSKLLPPQPPPAAAVLPDHAGAPETAQMNLLLSAQLAVFLNAAKNGLEPETYATLFYENAPDDLMEAIQKPDWFAQLCALAPEFAAYQPWCEQLRALVLGYLLENAANPEKLARMPSRALTPDESASKTASHGPGATSIQDAESRGE
jgi:hypothetical protein